MLTFFAILGWFVGAFVNLLIATEKNRSPIRCLILSLLLSPLVVWAYLVAVPSIPDGR